MAKNFFLLVMLIVIAIAMPGIGGAAALPGVSANAVPGIETDTPTNTPTDLPTYTPTNTPTDLPTYTPTNTPTDLPTDTPTSTPTGTPTDLPTYTPTNTPTALPTASPTGTPTPGNLGQLKVCKLAVNGVTLGKTFAFKVGSTNYSVPAGYCVLAGQFPLGTQVTIRETLPSGYSVTRMEVRPSNRRLSQDLSAARVIVRIGTGVTEVIYTNRRGGAPTATATRPPACTPNCPPTATPGPRGRLQICKEAGDPGVSGNFSFRFDTRSRSIPPGACSLIISVRAGTLVVRENADPNFTVADIYTIPANRLISKDLSQRKATVRIVQGISPSQTIVVFVNRSIEYWEGSEDQAAASPIRTLLQRLRSALLPWMSPAP